jgi:hypothetical protein
MPETWASRSTWAQRLRCDPLGSLNVHGMKRFPSALDVETDRIDRGGSAGERTGDGLLVMDVGLDRLQVWIIGTEQSATALRMPGGNPDGKLVLAQMAYDAAAEKAGSSENGDETDAHGGTGTEAMSPRPSGS